VRLDERGEAVDHGPQAEFPGVPGAVGGAVRGARRGPDPGRQRERAFQVRDPNGVIVELLDWNAPVAG
jgi:hypothetical protein